jgi:nucleotide-binding universal stress UspA family protein
MPDQGDMTEHGAARWADVDAAIEAAAESAFAFLERLVAEPSTVGAECGSNDVVASELARGDPATELIRMVENRGIDLLAMSTHGHRGPSRTCSGRLNPVAHLRSC